MALSLDNKVAHAPSASAASQQSQSQLDIPSPMASSNVNAPSNLHQRQESMRSARAASIHSRYNSQLGDSQVEQLKIAFNLFDKDHNGKITVGELQTVLKTLGQNITKEEAEEMMATVDLNNDGLMDFSEFVVMMENRIFLPSNTSEYEDAFKFFDKNGDGTIDFHELKDVLLSLGEDFKDSDIQDMIDEADMTGTGSVSFIEFIQMMPDNIQENYTKCLDREKDDDSMLKEEDEPKEESVTKSSISSGTDEKPPMRINNSTIYYGDE